MRSNYLIVDRRVLPDYFEKVVEARSMLGDGTVKDVSEAAKRVGISRSTYYKYKDFVFAPDDVTLCKKAVFGMTLRHEQGILGDVLNTFSHDGGQYPHHQPKPPHPRQRQRGALGGHDPTSPFPRKRSSPSCGKRKGVASMKLIAIE